MPIWWFFYISHLGLSDTRRWRVFLYSVRWTIVALADYVHRSQGGWKDVGLHCFMFAAFCFMLYISPSLFCRSVIGCGVLVRIVGPWANLKCNPDFHIHVLIIPNYIFLFCKWNTLGHVGLTILGRNSLSPRVLELKVK